MKCCLLLLLILGLAGCDRNPTPVQATVGDTYPGDAAYTRKVLDLLNSVRNNRINLLWAGNRTLSRRDFCLELVNRHFSGTSQGQGQTCAGWLNCPDLNQDTLLAACEQALANPDGFDGPEGWNRWRGIHRGTWHQDQGDPPAFNDLAEWDPPRKEPTKVPGDNDATGNPREYDFQKVTWPGPPPRHGWNQSHPDVPYVWGWGPKEGHDERGDIATHIGFPFSIGPCHFIIWLTRKEGFLEGINTGGEEDRTVNGHPVRGYPKTSTGFNGRGQWVVDR